MKEMDFLSLFNVYPNISLKEDIVVPNFLLPFNA
jgi:hypothetical protein